MSELSADALTAPIVKAKSSRDAEIGLIRKLVMADHRNLAFFENAGERAGVFTVRLGKNLLTFQVRKLDGDLAARIALRPRSLRCVSSRAAASTTRSRRSG